MQRSIRNRSKINENLFFKKKTKKKLCVHLTTKIDIRDLINFKTRV